MKYFLSFDTKYTYLSNKYSNIHNKGIFFRPEWNINVFNLKVLEANNTQYSWLLQIIRVRLKRLVFFNLFMDL